MSTTSYSILPGTIGPQLTRLKARLQTLVIAGGLGMTVCVACGALALSLVGDYLWDLPSGARAVLLAVTVLLAAGGGLYWVVWPLLRSTSALELAALVEDANPQFQERLLSAIELSQTDISRGEAGSPVMRRWLLQETQQSIRDVNFADAAPSQRALKRVWGGAIALTALCLPMLFASQAYGLLISRFVNPWGNYERIGNLILEVEDAERSVARGSDVEIAAVPKWRVGSGDFPASGWLTWQPDGGRNDRKRLHWDAERGGYVALLPHVVHGFTYDVAAGSARTRRFHINVVDRLEVTGLSADVDPPAYSGEPSAHYDAASGEIVALEQSEVRLEVKTNKPLKSARFVWLAEPNAEKGAKSKDLSVPMPLGPDGTTANWSKTVDLKLPADRFVVEVVDQDGLRGATSAMRLTVVPDQAPLIEFADREDSAEARPDDVVPFPLVAADDFGLKSVELHYSFISPLNIEEKGVLPADPSEMGSRSWHGTVPFDVAKLGLKSGTSVVIRGRATDGRPVPGPNETWTRERLLLIKQDAKPYGENTVAAKQQQIREAFQDLEKQLREKQQQAEQLKQQAEQARQEQQQWTRNDELDELQGEIDRISQQMEQLASHLAQTPLFAGLAQQTTQIKDTAVAPAGESVTQAQQAELSEKPRDLNRASQQLKQAADEVARMQQQFEQLAEIQKDLLELNRLAAQTERLADGVERLENKAEELSQMPPAQQQAQERQLALEHQQLQRVHQQLDNRLDDLLERRPELMEAVREDLTGQLDELARLAEELAARQQEVAQALEARGEELAKQLQPVGQQQEQLQQQVEQLLQQAARLPNSPLTENGAAEVQAQQQVMQQLQAGNPQQAAEQLATAIEALKQLAKGLEETPRPSGQPKKSASEVEKPESKPKTQPTNSGPGRPMPQPREEGPAPNQTSEQKPAREATSTNKSARPPATSKPSEEEHPPTSNKPNSNESPPKDSASNETKSNPSQPGEPEGNEPSQKGPPAPGPSPQQLAQQARQLAEKQQEIVDQLNRQVESAKQQAQSPSSRQPSERQPGAEPTQSPGTPQPQPMPPATGPDDTTQPPASEAKSGPSKQPSPQDRQQREQDRPETGSQKAPASANPEQQKEIQDLANQLAQQFEKKMEQLSQEPVSDPKTAERAQKAQQFTRQASQSMSQSKEQCACQNPGQAAQAGQQASEQLRQAAAAARGQSGQQSQSPQSQGQQSQGQQGQGQQGQGQQSQGQQGQGQQGQGQQGQGQQGQGQQGQGQQGQGQQGQQGSVVPSGVGNQVAQASQQLAQAGDALSKMQFKGVPGEKGQGDQQSQSGEGQGSEAGTEMEGSASESLQQAAKSMRQAAEQAGLGQQGQGQSGQGQPGGQGAPGSESSDRGNEGEMAPTANGLNLDLEGFTGRNWGQLPGTLKSELLESSRKSADGDYSRLIRNYFHDISKTRSPELGDQ